MEVNTADVKVCVNGNTRSEAVLMEDWNEDEDHGRCALRYAY